MAASVSPAGIFLGFALVKRWRTALPKIADTLCAFQFLVGGMGAETVLLVELAFDFDKDSGVNERFVKQPESLERPILDPIEAETESCG
jgi:hypothetical protein